MQPQPGQMGTPQTGTPQSQNLINAVREPKHRISSEPGFGRALAADILLVASAALLGYWFRGYVDGSVTLMRVLYAALVFGVLSSLSVFIPRHRGRKAFVILVECAALMAPFWNFPWRWTLAAFAVLMLFLESGEFLAERALGENLKIRFFRVEKSKMTRWVTGLALAAVILFVGAQQEQSAPFISKDAFLSLYTQSAAIATRVYPVAPLGGTFGDFVSGVAATELKGNSAFLSLSASNKATAEQEVERQVAGNFKLNGALPSASEPLWNVFYSSLLDLLHTWENAYGPFFWIGWGFVLFLFVRSFGVIFAWVESLAAFLCYHLLLALNVLHVTEENATREVIEF